jgi:hypothetical protein
MFNPQGRVYFYGILKQILMSPFIRVTFVVSFATDQSVSFITSLKDLAYTLCFYGSDFTVNDVKDCLRHRTFDGIIVGYVVALIPLLLKLIQCYKQAKQESGSFLGHLQMYNFIKFVSSVVTSTLSFISSFYPSLFIPFILSSIVSTLYSHYWDIVSYSICRNMTGVFLRWDQSTLFSAAVFATAVLSFTTR